MSLNPARERSFRRHHHRQSDRTRSMPSQRSWRCTRAPGGSTSTWAVHNARSRLMQASMHLSPRPISYSGDSSRDALVFHRDSMEGV